MLVKLTPDVERRFTLEREKERQTKVRRKNGADGVVQGQLLAKWNAKI
jgi:hypothetical protein